MLQQKLLITSTLYRCKSVDAKDAVEVKAKATATEQVTVGTGAYWWYILILLLILFRWYATV